jgi:hypothetical protein
MYYNRVLLAAGAWTEDPDGQVYFSPVPKSTV